MKMGGRSHGGEKRTTRLARFGCLVVIKSVEIMAHGIDLGADSQLFFQSFSQSSNSKTRIFC
jgi:hypothetical protein